MKAFSQFHPIVSAVYFAVVIITVMLVSDPVLQAEALLGGALFAGMQFPARRNLKRALYYCVFALIIVVTNPLFSHNGATVLFSVGRFSVSLEAFFYGGGMAALMIGVIVWCELLSVVITDEKFMYLLGRVLPKLSLVLSYTIRLVPVIVRRIRRVSGAQKTMGLYSEDSRLNRIRSRGEVLRTVVTWSLESSVDTSLSMSARGYGLRGRTTFSRFRFGGKDAALLALTAALAAVVFIGAAKGAVGITYYPTVDFGGFNGRSLPVYLAFFCLTLTPFAVECKEEIKWKYCVSKI